MLNALRHQVMPQRCGAGTRGSRVPCALWFNIFVTVTELPATHLATRTTPWAVFSAFVIATLVRGTGIFAYDAYGYWTAAQRVVGSAPASPGGFWELRGVLAGFVYVPAAALSRLIGPAAAGFSVLLQNSLVLAWVAAFLLPRVIRQWGPASSRTRWLGAFLIWLTVGGFARYPLIDIYAAIACVVIVLLLRSRRMMSLAIAGLVGGIAVNLRPAYMVTVLIIAVLAVAWRRWAGLLVPAGIAVGLVPQVVLNLIRYGTWSVSPAGSGGLVALQAGFASYLVRYDTVLGSASPMQSYCSPSMAERIGSPLPSSMDQLASAFLGHFPTAVVFSLEKVSAALHWPMSAPYATPTPGLDALFAALITAITVVGLAALIRLAIRVRRPPSSERWFGWAIIAAVVIGAVLTLVSSATETRFALPLVLLGAIGCTTLVGIDLGQAWTRGRNWAVGTLIILLGVTTMGYVGLSHPAPSGAVNVVMCAAL